MTLRVDAGTTPASRTLDWRIVLAALPFGLAFAAVTILGVVHGLAATQTAALGVLTTIALFAAVAAPSRPFRHGLAAGLVAALAAVEVQALFLPTYFVNNPETANLEMPFGLSPRMATALLVSRPRSSLHKARGHFMCWRGVATKPYLDISRSRNDASAQKGPRFRWRISGTGH